VVLDIAKPGASGLEAATRITGPGLGCRDNSWGQTGRRVYPPVTGPATESLHPVRDANGTALRESWRGMLCFLRFLS
jgi:hypothetical protein